MEKLSIIKIGGKVLDDAATLKKFLQAVAIFPGKKIIIHGGGKKATEVSGKLGIETQMLDGRRITDADTIDVVTMVYAGLINKNIVASLNSLGCKSIGLCGADMQLIPAVKRPAAPIDYGFVGDVLYDEMLPNDWQTIINQNIVPIIAPITADTNGQLLNTNADTIASAVARVLSIVYEVELYYCFEKLGVLTDADDENTLVEHINSEIFASMKASGAITGGMIPKIENALNAIDSGVNKVYIGNVENIIYALKGDGGRMTGISSKS